MEMISEVVATSLKSFLHPQHGEGHSIQQSIADAETTLQHMDNGIDKLLELQKHVSDGIKTLKEQRRKVADDLSQYRLAVAPHTRLPDELLSKVFIICASDYGSVSFPLKKKAPPYQLVLSHVSKRWRHVALATHELWTDASVTDLEIWDRRDRSKRICHRWLSRAGNRAITLSLDLKRTRRDSSAYLSDLIQKFVLPLKIQKLFLEGFTSQLSKLSQMPNDTLSDVEELHINIVQLDTVAPLAMPPVIDKTCSIKLSQLTLDQDRFGQYLQGLPFPWSRLRKFESKVAGILLSQWVMLLRQTPLLEECELVVMINDLNDEEELTLSHLRSFSFKLLHLRVDEVIRHFKFPSLERLVMIDCGDWTPETYGIIKRQYNLQRLQQFSCSGYPLPISRILNDAPELRVLDLSSSDAIIDDEGIMGISSGDLGRFIVSFTIKCAEDDVEEMLCMVEARLKNVKQMIDEGYTWKEGFTALRDVGIHNNGRETYAKRVGALKSAGVEVRIGGSGISGTRII